MWAEVVVSQCHPAGCPASPVAARQHRVGSRVNDPTGVRVYDAFTGAPVTGLYSGMALEVIVANQHVVGVYRVNG